MKHVTILETFLGGKLFFLSWRLAQNWVPIVSGNVHSPRTPHNLVGPEHKGFDVIQHAFAPQGGGRIEDAARHRRPSRLLGVGCTEDGVRR